MDLAALRREFPALDPARGAARLAYLDSAATTLTPRVVIEAVAHALGTMGNPGRGVYPLSEAATDAIAIARTEVATLLGASSLEEVVVTSGTTASINLVADAWGRVYVGADDVVIATDLEHHSNYLPWQRLCAQRGARFVVAPVDDAGCIDLAALHALLARHGERVKLVAVAHVSNVVGTVAPIAEITRAAHAVGALVLVDGAQAVAHLPVDVRALDADFYAFSGHKIYGPPGVGVLWARAEILAAMEPWQVGGGMVGRIALDESQRTRYREAPARFEAGTPNTPAIAGLAAALAWWRGVASEDAGIHAKLRDAIEDAGARVIGAPVLGVVAFAWDYHPHDIATILAREGVAVRSGHHCAQPIHARFGVDASTRVSVGCYSGLDDVEQFARALAKVRATLGARGAS